MCVLALLVSLYLPGVLYADESPESRIALRLIEEAPLAEPVWLEVGGHSFLNLYTDAHRQREDITLILLPTMGAHPDWPELIHPLRLALGKANWANLSIQLPLPLASARAYGKRIPEALRRLHAAIRHLETRGHSRIVLVGHGFGALIAAKALADKSSASLLGMVGIGMQDYPFLQPPADLDALLARIDRPVLDIYPRGAGTNSEAQALNRRLAARRGNNRHYLQTAFAADSPYFGGQESALVERIEAWLRQSATADE